MQTQTSNVIYLADFRDEKTATEQKATDVPPRPLARELQQLRLQRFILLIAVVVLFAIAVLGG